MADGIIVDYSDDSQDCESDQQDAQRGREYRGHEQRRRGIQEACRYDLAAVGVSGPMATSSAIFNRRLSKAYQDVVVSRMAGDL